MKFILDILIYVAIGAGLSWYFYSIRGRDLLGGFVGGLIVGLLGAILGGFVLNNPLNLAIEFLQRGLLVANVNVIAGILGGYFAVYMFNKINNDRTRRDR
ncbi:MAG: hypothetical protein KDK41_09020 [Leptospiraceae bacterium]|nr:hypothetical protein [Leptospiraceae bacterium]MCB1200774.1 hypothetical protein [Leptospiraceae bacterium]